jgi:hypothetical protein
MTLLNKRDVNNHLANTILAADWKNYCACLVCMSQEQMEEINLPLQHYPPKIARESAGIRTRFRLM